MGFSMSKPKIQIPNIFIPADHILQSQTEDYWYLSRVWHGRVASKIGVGEALQMAADILEDLDPSKRLAVRTRMIRDNIVEYGSKQKMKRQTPCNDVPRSRITVL